MRGGTRSFENVNLYALFLDNTDTCVEGDGVWHHDRVGETDVGVRGQPPARAEAPAHCALLRQNNRPQQHHDIHHHGVLRRRGSLSAHLQKQKRGVGQGH